MSQHDIFDKDEDFQKDVDNLKELMLDGHSRNGAIIQLAINEFMTNLENKNSLENKFA